MTTFSCCRKPLNTAELGATCSCGETYCRTCIGIFTPDELEATIADARSKGHSLTMAEPLRCRHGLVKHLCIVCSRE